MTDTDLPSLSAPRRAPLTTPDTIAQWLWRCVLVGVAYFAAGRLGLAFPEISDFITLFWPAAGIAVAALVRWGPSVWPGVMVGAWAATVSAGAPPGLAVAVAAGNTLGPWACAWVLARAGFDPQLRRRRDLWLLLGAGAFGGMAITSANGCAWMAFGGRIAAVDLPGAWLTWWMGDSLGLVVAGVPLLALGHGQLRRSLRGSGWVSVGAALAAAVACAALAIASTPRGGHGVSPLLFVPPVLLGWLAVRAGVGLASCGVFALAVGSGLLAAAGVGPFQPGNVGNSIGLLWAYIASQAALVLLLHSLNGELLLNEQRWQLALEGAGLGVAEWNLRGAGGYLSRHWKTLLDDPLGQGTGSPEQFLARVHPDDREDARLSLQALRHPEQGSLWRQLRLRVRDRWSWFEMHALVAERDDDGQPQRIVAALSDVQERRSAEDRQRLSSSLFQNLHEGLLVADADLRVLDVNPTFCKLLGVPREELMGTVPSLLRAPTPDPMMRQQQSAMWSSLRASGHWTGEVLERRRSGDPCALHVTVFSVPDPDGATRYHVLMVSDVTEQRLQRERLERQAHFDELTRLPNRARLSQLLTQAMAAADREGYLLVLCYLDLDHFKDINDRFGHEAGDRLLVDLANRLRGALRAHASWADLAGRLGGDEFMLLLRASTMDEARLAVERVQRVMSQPYLLVDGNEPVVVNASLGATVYPVDRCDAETLLRHADQAMYAAKQAGRNGHVFFDPEHSRRNEERVMAIGRVQDALDRGELVLHYQPKVDLKRGTLLGVEALLRWNHPENGVVAPAQFLPLIEHTGLSASVGDWVLSQALEQLDAWQRGGLDISVSVNLSARHLQEPDFAQRLAELLARHARPLGHRLELEVLETAALADIARTSALLAQCARLGVRFALDDFGTGYSTLTYLKKLPVQVLKIDRSFVHNMLDDAQDRAIVEGVISLARTFDCEAVAEGVETPAQARLLLDLGCEVGQGVGIAPPMPAGEVLRWARDWRGLFAITAAPAPLPAPLAAPAPAPAPAVPPPATAPVSGPLR